METFTYFAYGSNMLTEWLKDRCPSAEAIGNARALDHRLAFAKKSNDGSGKATLLHSPGSVAHGVLFRIPMNERGELDRAEGKDYRRDDSFVVAGISSPVTTYLAVPNALDFSLNPYCWYRDLVRAGAKQHGLPNEYQAHLANIPADIDPDATGQNARKAISFLLGAERMEIEAFATIAVDCGFKIHEGLGPGLLESVYEAVLARSLAQRGLFVERQKPVPIRLDGIILDEGFRVDLLVEGKLLIELKSVERNAPVHGKQVLTYLRLMDLPLGLLMNFGTATFKEGIKRVANNHSGDASRYRTADPIPGV